MGRRIIKLVPYLLVVLMAGAAVAQTEQAIREQLFGETDAIKARADDLNAKMLAPKVYADGMEEYIRAGDELKRGRNLDRVRSRLTQATAYFEKATTAAELSHVTFAGALAAREAAQAAEAPTYSSRKWSRAEDQLVSAAQRLEGGNLNRAANVGQDAEQRYREAESEAIANRAKEDAK